MSPRRPVRAPRTGSPRPAPPVPDLAADAALERTGSPPVAGRTHEGLLFEGRDLPALDAAETRLVGCVLADLHAEDLVLTRARVLDSRVRGLVSTTAAWSSSTWQDVVLDHPRIGALTAPSATLTRVSVTGGRIDFANLRETTLTDVTFTDCDLRDLDAMGARWTRVRFQDCRLGSLELASATLRDVDVSTSELSAVAGVGSLRGLTVSGVQLLQLAPAMAGHLGLVVAPD